MIYSRYYCMNIIKTITVGFGQDFDLAELIVASEPEGVRTRATYGWKGLEKYNKNILTPKIIILWIKI